LKKKNNKTETSLIFYFGNNLKIEICKIERSTKLHQKAPSVRLRQYLRKLAAPYFPADDLRLN